MKTSDINNAMPRLQTISECPRAGAKTCPAHSNGKPDVPVTITSINVRFAPDLIHQFQLNPTKGALPADPAPFRGLAEHSEKLEVATTTAKSLLSPQRARSAGAPDDARRKRRDATRAKTKQHQDKL